METSPIIEMPVEKAAMHTELPAITEDNSLVRIPVNYRKKRIIDKGTPSALEKSVAVAKKLPAVESKSQKKLCLTKKMKPALRPFHYINIFGQQIHARSNTPAADSVFYIWSTLGRKPSDKLWDPKGINKHQSLRHQTLLLEAQKWVDPVVYTGSEKRLQGLTGNDLRDAIRQHASKIYISAGTWVHDEETRREIVKNPSSGSTKFRVFRAFVFSNRHSWTKPYISTLKKPRRKTSPRKEKLAMRQTECSPLQWSSTPETEPMAANLEAEPCFQTYISVARKELYHYFWWKKPDSSNKTFFEVSENNIEPTQTINVNQGNDTKGMGIDTMVVTGNALTIIQETHHGDDSIYVDALESFPTDAARSCYWDWIWPGLTTTANYYFQQDGDQELSAADGLENSIYWNIFEVFLLST